MAVPMTSINLFSEEFVICAGSVPFQISDTGGLSICLLHVRSKNKWCLPKGRKDITEAIHDTAVRETTEETGFPCTLLPIDMHTRATLPGEDRKDRPRFHRAVSTEPFAVTLRHMSENNMKTIYWFVTLIEESERQLQGTRMPSEHFESVFWDADEAVEKLSLPSQREVARKAVDLVRKALAEP